MVNKIDSKKFNFRRKRGGLELTYNQTFSAPPPSQEPVTRKSNCCYPADTTQNALSKTRFSLKRSLISKSLTVLSRYFPWLSLALLVRIFATEKPKVSPRARYLKLISYAVAQIGSKASTLHKVISWIQTIKPKAFSYKGRQEECGKAKQCCQTVAKTKGQKPGTT